MQLPGITQVQVNERAGLTFARGLRSILRQDPDVVLVGEVRDRETAELALEASLTGHLVLTTLHTNSAVAAITRLVDMGVEPFLVASSLTAASSRSGWSAGPARRAPRRTSPTAARSPLLGIDAGRPRRRHARCAGAGCADCGGTGYRGRTAVFEVLDVDAGDAAGAAQRPERGGRRRPARAAGMLTLRAAAVVKARTGETTFEEVLRVTHSDHVRRCRPARRAPARSPATWWCAPGARRRLDRGRCRSCSRAARAGLADLPLVPHPGLRRRARPRPAVPAQGPPGQQAAPEAAWGYPAG